MDIEPRAIVIAEASPSRRGEYCTASVPRDADAGIVPGVDELLHLRGLLERRGFSGREFVATLPTTSFVFGEVEIGDSLSDEDIDAQCSSHLADLDRCDANDLIAEWWPMPIATRPRAKGRRMFAIGARRQLVDELLTSFEKVGMSLVGIDARPLAMVRACRASCTGPLSPILSVSWDYVNLAILVGDTVVSIRVLPDLGWSSLGEFVAKTSPSLDFTPSLVLQCVCDLDADEPQLPTSSLLILRSAIDRLAESLGFEIDRSLRFIQEEYGLERPDQVVVADIKSRTLADALRGSTDLNLVMAQERLGKQVAPPEFCPHECATSIGLALYNG